MVSADVLLEVPRWSMWTTVSSIGLLHNKKMYLYVNC